MSNTKKNTGCKDCIHYEETGIFYDGRTVGDICNSGLTINNSKKNDFKMGVIDASKGYLPSRENKNLTCKGFTPIDWKAKYEESQKNKPDLDIYVKKEDYETVLKSNIKLKKTIKIDQIFVIGAGILVGIAVLIVFLSKGA